MVSPWEEERPPMPAFRAPSHVEVPVVVRERGPAKCAVDEPLIVPVRLKAPAVSKFALFTLFVQKLRAVEVERTDDVRSFSTSKLWKVEVAAADPVASVAQISEPPWVLIVDAVLQF